VGASKKKRKTTAQYIRRPATRRESSSTSGLWTLLTRFAAGILIALVCIPSYWLFGQYQPYATIIIGGVLSGLLCVRFIEVCFSAAGFSALLCFLYPWLFSVERFMARASTASDIYFGDIIMKYYYEDLLLPLARSADLNSINPVALGVASLVGAVVIGNAIGVLVSRVERSNRKNAFYPLPINIAGRGRLSMIVALVLVVSMAVISYGNASAFRLRNNEIIQPGTYATDYHLYKRTYQLMLRGLNYYQALDISTDQDARDLKKSTFWSSPSWVRHPFIYRVWAFVGRTDANAILVLALILSLFTVLLVGLALERLGLYGSGPLVTLLAYPYFVVAVSWENLFNPDLWAVMLLVLSFGLLANRWRAASIACAFLSLMCRLQAGIWLGVLLVFYLIQWRKPFARKLVAMTVAALGIAGVLYVAHWSTIANKYPTILTVDNPSRGIGFPIGWAGWADFSRRLVWISNFMIDQYAYFLFYGVVLVFLGLCGFMVSLFTARRVNLRSSEYMDLVAAPLFIVTFLLALALIPWSSQYWGMYVLPMSFVGIASGVASLLVLMKCTANQQAS